MTDMTPEAALALRKPFPPESIGKLPKGGAMLDFVGHAGITDRLLTVDPHWSWEPFALDERGLPALDGKGNLWIKLTICGVTRIGVGDGKNAKEIIGDALRNAAMRFGVALDLWAKESLIEFQQAAQAAQVERVNPPEPAPQPVPDEAWKRPTDQARKAMFAMLTERRPDITTREDRLRYVALKVGRDVESSSDLSADEVGKVLDALNQEHTTYQGGDQ